MLSSGDSQVFTIFFKDLTCLSELIIGLLDPGAPPLIGNGPYRGPMVKLTMAGRKYLLKNS